MAEEKNLKQKQLEELEGAAQVVVAMVDARRRRRYSAIFQRLPRRM
jgi:hypothetical protein